MPTPAQWRKVKLEYQKGEGSLRQLGIKHNIPQSTITQRSAKDKWTASAARLQSKVEAIQENKVITEATRWVDDTIKRSWKWRNNIDATLKQSPTDDKGNTLLEPSDIDTITKAEQRIDDMARKALMIPDITTPSINFTQNNYTDIKSVREAWEKELGWNGQSTQEPISISSELVQGQEPIQDLE